ncbi:unnamed protein product [Ostreobium quekettii]|uniref:Uncharacterized protein n=1 Tax=Ostreobium quekettii TaxID=121088 RepID=A0A8S1JC91_9CHLO|nr:unnamed protein product [Ostreobium quekettii]|eukprot:evm.model.scf_58.15 EVM.evm.TU.scf_58.15   scf_58:139298-140458(+)
MSPPQAARIPLSPWRVAAIPARHEGPHSPPLPTIVGKAFPAPPQPIKMPPAPRRSRRIRPPPPAPPPRPMASATRRSPAPPGWHAPAKHPQASTPSASIDGGIQSPAWPPEGPIRRPDGFLQTTAEDGPTELAFELGRGRLSLTCDAIGQDAVDRFVDRFLRFMATGFWDGRPGGPFGASLCQPGAAAARGFVFSLGLTPEFALLLLPYWTEKKCVEENRASEPGSLASPQVSMLCRRLQRMPFGTRAGDANREAGGDAAGKDGRPSQKVEKGRPGRRPMRVASLEALQGKKMNSFCRGSRPRGPDPPKAGPRWPGWPDRKRGREGCGGRRGRQWKKRGRGNGGRWAWDAPGAGGGQKRCLECGAAPPPGGGRRADARPLAKRRLG